MVNERIFITCPACGVRYDITEDHSKTCVLTIYPTREQKTMGNKHLCMVTASIDWEDEDFKFTAEVSERREDYGNGYMLYQSNVCITVNAGDRILTKESNNA